MQFHLRLEDSRLALPVYHRSEVQADPLRQNSAQQQPKESSSWIFNRLLLHSTEVCFLKLLLTNYCSGTSNRPSVSDSKAPPHPLILPLPVFVFADQILIWSVCKVNDTATRNTFLMFL